ncbi:dipicolinate synthase subunit B [Anaerotruncus rubiinfantis]|uniref:dipicolinate synthase subunit B n=1 Tax=Anaerotruncus rubiinfantis TaxID=1720200 RepID=UPI000834A16D|nr:dipicolinate synthase subunit B [Anaerotruncus rubiinfantis]
MEKLKLGFALTGSFCTWGHVLPQMEKLAKTYEIMPIISPISCVSDNRFGKADEWIEKIEKICGRPVIRTIEQAEPIGPKNLLDALVVAPCTGNTLGKLANGITDTCVCMACKASLRNANPLVIAVSTNDALGASARNIATLMNAKNVYFVPMSQDDPQGKPTSLVAHFDKIGETVEASLSGKQLQPLYL